ncbi:MAG: phosphatidylserine/phosphatidylglycerophosphate/cardiolipin synthase family protein [Myxococcales bacterium]|nr:phosphatidylserine/phosphatidylglycerophosphate/cardiolipin synthase family protein [Myxococcales bacterium]
MRVHSESGADQDGRSRRDPWPKDAAPIRCTSLQPLPFVTQGLGTPLHAPEPRRDVTRPPASLQLKPNTGIRPPPGYWATKAIQVGLRAPETTVATRAALWAAEQGRVAGRGAPLPESLHPATQAALDALRPRFGRALVLDQLLRDSSSAHLATLDRALGQGAGPGLADIRSLRELVSRTYKADVRRAALRTVDEHLAQARRLPHETLHDLIADPTGLRGHSVDGRIPNSIDKVLSIRRLGRMGKADLVNHHEVTTFNRAQVYTGGKEAFRAILQAVGQAKSSIHISYFILKNDRSGNALVDLLIKRAREGVRVRVQLDEAGALLAGHPPGRVIQKLRGGGVHVVCNRVVDADRQMRPFNRPDHRKQVIIDGRTAFTGGLNIGDDYIHDWQDVVMLAEGDVVHQLQADWMLNWMALHGELDAGLDDEGFRKRYFPAQGRVGTCRIKLAQTIPGESQEIRRTVLNMIGEAQHSIRVATPYLTSLEVQEALLRAAHRGVRIQVVLPGENNHKTCEIAAWNALRALMRAGVEVYVYPGMSHGKVMVVDDTLTTMGTANMDDLSLVSNYEMNLNSDDRGLAQQVVKQVFERDIARSRQLRPDDVTLGRVIGAHAMRPFTGLL